MAAGDGLTVITPTSIAHSGTSASINAKGGVDFVANTSLSLNGVFTSTYENYLIVIRFTYSEVASYNLEMRMRSSGTDATGASDYTYQTLNANSATVNGARTTTSAGALFIRGNVSVVHALHWHIYGPALAQPTVYRTLAAPANSGGRIYDCAGTHNQSTSYDGTTINAVIGNNTGSIYVYGYEE